MLGLAFRLLKEGAFDHSEEGNRYLGAALGTDAFQQYFVEAKVEKWCQELLSLCDVAKKEPQLAYSAFTICLSKRWLYTMRTMKNIGPLFQPLEDIISSKFLPILLNGYQFSDIDRRLYGLPTKFGGLGIFNPVSISQLEFERSLSATRPLVDLIKEQNVAVCGNKFNDANQSVHAAKSLIKQQKVRSYQQELDILKQNLTPHLASNIDALCEKGVSSWLTTLPLEEFGFTFNKAEFSDALRMRYKHPLKNLPRFCVCSKPNSIDHALSCPNGGYTCLRHNQLRDLIAHWLTGVCKDVTSEPKLIPLSGEQLRYRSAVVSDNARLDIVARGVWSTLDKIFLNVRVFHPGTDSNAGALKKVYKKHESEKKRAYGKRVINVEKATFTPLVFATTGGVGSEADAFLKSLGSLMSNK